MTIRETLKEGRPLLFDGAMGTYYAARPGRADARCELGNLEHPEDISAIHRAYLDSGCRAIRTNTFDVGAMLAAGDEALAQSVVEAGCRLALEAAKPYGAYVFADLGPAPQDTPDPGGLYCRQAAWFLAQGVRHFVAETLPSDEGIAALARFLKDRAPDAFFIVSFAVGPDGMTKEGLAGRTLYRRTAQLPEVDAVGFNCVSGPHHLLEYIRALEPEDKPLSVMPNAGYPTVLGRRVVFQGQPDYFADQMARIVQAGAAIVGGCCGTTPEHIAHTAAALKETPSAKPAARAPAESLSAGGHVNPLRDKLEAGARIIAVELDPPTDDDLTFFLDGVKTLRDAGADVVTISDCPIGRPRADSSLLACKIKRELGVEPLPHMTCRDRNLNATKALLLGLSIEGVHNVLLVTGDPIPTEDRGEVKSVFNFNSRKLIRYVSGLNDSALRTPFTLFGALNLNAKNFAVQLELAQEKEKGGVSGFLTQPVHSKEALENLKLARKALKGKLLGGVFPIVSHRNACFLNNEVSGVRVADEIVTLYEGKGREEAEELAVTTSVRIAKEMAPYVDGYYLMTPFRRVELMTRIMEQIR